LSNLDALVALPAIKTATDAVTTALSFTAYVADRMTQQGSELLLRRPTGELEHIVMPQFTPITARMREIGGDVKLPSLKPRSVRQRKRSSQPAMPAMSSN
jgi:hypothetical protein